MACRLFVLRVGNISDKISRANQNTNFAFNNLFFQKIVPLHDYVEKYDTPGKTTMTIVRRMRIACWVPKATNTLSEYVTRITTTVARTHLNVTSYVQYIACLNLSNCPP